jgi:hypothetical protein
VRCIHHLFLARQNSIEVVVVVHIPEKVYSKAELSVKFQESYRILSGASTYIPSRDLKCI